MAFNVRIFGYRGTRLLPKVLSHQYSADSVQMLDQPYVWGQTLNVSGAAVESAPDLDGSVQILSVEVPDGKSIRYEIKTAGSDRVADINSPILSGHNQFYFGAGWTISMIDAEGLD